MKLLVVPTLEKGGGGKTDMGLAMRNHRGRGDDNSSSSQTVTSYKKGGDEEKDLGVSRFVVEDVTRSKKNKR